MHFPARSCAPILSATTGRISQRGAQYASLGKIGSAGMNEWSGNGSSVFSRHIRSFSGSCLTRDIGLGASGASPVTKLRCAGPAAVPGDCLAWIQTRKFRTETHRQASGDKQTTEELWEKFQVKEGNQQAQPRRTVLREDGGNGKSLMEGETCPERLTKGKKGGIMIDSSDNADFWR